VNLRDEFEKETGRNWISKGTDGVHVVLIEVPSIEYVEWLEKKVEYLRMLNNDLLESKKDRRGF
jgi:hypothetical protein